MNKSTFSEIRLLVLFVLVVMVAALSLYLFQFNDSLSNKSADWGNFGSYINGVLSPILLFLTLLYIANTLRAQKESQLKQSEEFSNQLQEMVNANQINQITGLRTEIIGLINNEVAFFIKRFDKLQSEISEATKCIQTIKGPTGNLAPTQEIETLRTITQNNSKEMIKANNMVIKLQRLTFNVLTGNFTTVDSLREKFEIEYRDIHKKYGDWAKSK